MRLVLRQLGGLAVGKRETALNLGVEHGSDDGDATRGAAAAAAGRGGGVTEPATTSSSAKQEDGEAALTFDALRLRVAKVLGRLDDAERLKLVHKGKVLKSYLALPAFRDGDVISYAFSLRAPDQYLRERVDGGFEEQEEQELKYGRKSPTRQPIPPCLHPSLHPVPLQIPRTHFADRLCLHAASQRFGDLSSFSCRRLP